VSSGGGFSDVEPLDASHVVEGFSCGRAELDTWLVKHSLQSHTAGSSRTRVVCQGRRVVGFYSLAVGSVDPDDAPRRVVKGLPRHPVPVVILTRLAVDRSAQGTGLGSALLKDALMRVAEVAEAVDVRALLVQAKDEDAKEWYRRRVPFEPSPLEPLQLFLLLKDLRAALASSS
jgi:GNAT superfamily N-acetyltransferase